MGKMESTIKSEINRIARKEIRSATDPLRREVRELKRVVRELGATVKPLAREARKASRADEARLTNLSVDEAEVKAARINGKWVKSLRAKINVSQMELATLLGISVSGVRTWEYDTSRPRGRNRQTLVALRKLGRRDVARLLASGKRG